jgi:PAS domain S-box-containing protein
VQNTDALLELFFSQSLDGFFFMMLDEPIQWDDTVDKEKALDYVFEHQRITKVNDAMLAQYRTTREQFLGRRPKDLFLHDLEYGRHIWRDFFDRGRLHLETDERRADGSQMWIEGDYICFYDTAGRITGHFGIQRDVTDRKQAEVTLKALHQEIEAHAAKLEARVAERTAELRRSENRLWAIGTSLPDPVFVFDEDGRYAEILTTKEQLLYRHIDEMKGRRLHDVLPKATADLSLDLVRRTIETRLPQVLEYSLHLAAGERWFEGRTNPLDMELNGKRCVVFVARDITDTKRAQELESQNVYLQEELKAERSFGSIVGGAPRMRQVFTSIGLVAGTDSTVLILGETGTGKELIARAIHTTSKRRRGVMVKVNCAAIPGGLAESELFGHERGAFTGAVSMKKGRFELAHHGTIFLDEVGELTPELQVKLLRVLQEQELERVGGTQTIRVDVRVIAATNRDLRAEVERGAFRADLFYRLNIFPIEVPPLRDRVEDVPLLADHFVNEFAQKIGKPTPRLSEAALTRLTAYGWPGNVRELANVLERAVILCQRGAILEEHLAVVAARPGPRADRFLTLEEIERQHIHQALEHSDGVLAGPRGAARLLGMSRSTLWSRMRKLGISAPKPR